MSDRLFHTDGCALFEDHPTSRGCTCGATDRLALDEIEAQRQRAIDNKEAWDAWRAAGCPAGEILHPRDLYALRKRVAELEGQLKISAIAPVPGAAPNVERAWDAYQLMRRERDRTNHDLLMASTRVAELEAGIRGVLDRFDLSARDRLEALLSAADPAPDILSAEERARRTRLAWWASLTNDQRLQLDSCRGCGSLDLSCQCENDE